MVDLDPARAETALHVRSVHSHISLALSNLESVLVVLRAFLHPLKLVSQDICWRVPLARRYKPRSYLDYSMHNHWDGSFRKHLLVSGHLSMQSSLGLVATLSRIWYLFRPEDCSRYIIHSLSYQLVCGLDVWHSTLLHRSRLRYASETETSCSRNPCICRNVRSVLVYFMYLSADK
jgi:hypothetical protein